MAPSPSLTDDLRPGEVVRPYRVIQKLGSGGMGAVYRVEHRVHGGARAMKVLHRHLLHRDDDSAGRFLREARIAARVRHAHVVEVFEIGELADTRPYLVMELLRAPSVAQRIERNAISLAHALTLAAQLAEALAATHEQEVVHGDVSATNVLYGDDIGVKLVDFGLARVCGAGAPRPPIADIVYGTPRYVAPEVARGHAADAYSDQYSFGILLYELLTGRVPFADDDVQQLLRLHLYEPLPVALARADRAPLPAELVMLVNRCCAKSATARFPSMRAVADALAASRTATSSRRGSRWLALAGGAGTEH